MRVAEHYFLLFFHSVSGAWPWTTSCICACNIKVSLLSWSQSVDISLDSRDKGTKTLNHPISSHLVRARAHSLVSFELGEGLSSLLLFNTSVFSGNQLSFNDNTLTIFTLRKKAHNKNKRIDCKPYPMQGCKIEKKITFPSTPTNYTHDWFICLPPRFSPSYPLASFSL